MNYCAQRIENEGSKTTDRNKMKNNWFKRIGWFYFPASFPGAVLMLIGLAFCVQAFLAIDRHSHSVSDTLYGVFPYFACCFLLLNWIASNTSRANEDKPVNPWTNLP
jgi:hypothetical protein